MKKITVGWLKRGWFLGWAMLLLTGLNGVGRTLPDASDPVGFFTTVADKLLRNTFDFGVTNIPVCTNGVFVYSPAVQRILQLSANVYDAANTNWFPVVFRPCFSGDTNGNLSITGYTNVAAVIGQDDPRLARPLDVSVLLATGATNVFTNIYGVPWIIGAKKGLPSFNQFSMVNAVQVTRKLQVTRQTATPPPDLSTYATNQMYVMSITNNLGLSFWNSYISNYPNPLFIYVSDTVGMTLTNAARTWSGTTNFIYAAVVNEWPGSQWTGLPPIATPKSASYVAINWAFTFLPTAIYRFGTAAFDSANFGWETGISSLPPLPQFGLMTTNWLQAVILDGSHVIDYVQLRGPASSRNLNEELADPDFPGNSPVYYQWSTNSPPVTAPNYGVLNQLEVSRNPYWAPFGNLWSVPAGMPPGLPYTRDACSAYFNGFFIPSFYFNGQTYVNTQLTMIAPYIVQRTIFSTCLLQANDPLVHYLASDLNAANGAPAVWNSGLWQNGVSYQSDDLQSQPLPQPPRDSSRGRYQPWGRYRQMAGLAMVDTNAYHLAFKDPLVWGSDAWSFPTNLLSSLAGLGQVHRGTPWQTLYLKSTNILKETAGPGNIGTNTWMAWTGDFDAADAARMAPINDWRLADLLVSLLATNDVTQLLSVNDLSLVNWLNVFDGLTVYSNSTVNPYAWKTPTVDAYLVASNALPTTQAVSGIASTRAVQPQQNFYSLGDILATPELTVNSPWLNTANVSQLRYGISDAEYEAIPAQLLLRLRPDSSGSMVATNGGWNLLFSGSDALAYEVQESTDLVNWHAVSTNKPGQGRFTITLASPNAAARFYRSVLLH